MQSAYSPRSPFQPLLLPYCTGIDHLAVVAVVVVTSQIPSLHGLQGRSVIVVELKLMSNAQPGYFDVGSMQRCGC